MESAIEAVFPRKRRGGRRGRIVYLGAAAEDDSVGHESKLFQTAIGRDYCMCRENCATWTTRRGGSRTRERFEFWRWNESNIPGRDRTAGERVAKDVQDAKR